MGLVICETNLAHYPTQIFETEHTKEVTVGDLHGNAIKLIHFLIQHEGMHMSAKDYSALYQIYKKNNLILKDLEIFQNILERTRFDSALPLVRLMGDVLSDRGSNDYLTLLVLKRMKHAHINYRIIFSNHDQVALEAFDKRGVLDYDNFKFYPAQQCSLNRMSALVKSGVLVKAEVDDLIDEVYRPYVYLLDDTVVTGGLILYTHAPMGFDILKTLAHAFEVAYIGDSIDSFKHCIDEINQKAQAAIKAHRFSEAPMCGVNGEVYRFVWAREATRAYPTQFSVQNVHGHTGPTGEDWPAHLINLDNSLLGKSPEANQGTYQVYTICY